MSNLFIVGVDGSAASDRAVDFAIARAKVSDAKILLVHILEWSPYSFLTAEELAERHQRREQEIDRARSHFVAPVRVKIEEAGLSAEDQILYGHVADVMCTVAREFGAAQIFIGRTGHSKLGARLFGSVPTALVQGSPIPVTVVP